MNIFERNIIREIEGSIHKSEYCSRDLAKSFMASHNILEAIKEFDSPPWKLAFKFYLNGLKEYSSRSNEDIAEQSNISRGYFQELLSGHKNPSRDTVISLGIAFKLNPIETDLLLKRTGYSGLSSRDQRDVIIMNCIHNKKDIIETNTLLEQINAPLLGFR